MKIEPIHITAPIPPELLADFEGLVPITEERYRELGQAAAAITRSAEFKADLLKERIFATIRATLRDQKITQAELARRLGVSRQYLNKALHPDRKENFTLDTLVRVAEALGLDLFVRLLQPCEYAVVFRKSDVFSYPEADTFSQAPAINADTFSHSSVVNAVDEEPIDCAG